jgi:hypothetical protein
LTRNPAHLTCVEVSWWWGWSVGREKENDNKFTWNVHGRFCFFSTLPRGPPGQQQRGKTFSNCRTQCRDQGTVDSRRTLCFQKSGRWTQLAKSVSNFQLELPSSRFLKTEGHHDVFSNSLRTRASLLDEYTHFGFLCRPICSDTMPTLKNVFGIPTLAKGSVPR